MYADVTVLYVVMHLFLPWHLNICILHLTLFSCACFSSRQNQGCVLCSCCQLPYLMSAKRNLLSLWPHTNILALRLMKAFLLNFILTILSNLLLENCFSLPLFLASLGLWGCFVHERLTSLSLSVRGCLSWRSEIVNLSHTTVLFFFFFSELLHWYNFIYKSVLGLLPTYLSTCMSRKQCCHSLHSQRFITLSIPSVRTESGKNVGSEAVQYDSPRWF